MDLDTKTLPEARDDAGDIRFTDQQGNILPYWIRNDGGSYRPTDLNGKTIISSGDVKQILPFPGAGIGMFDGTNSYLTTPHTSDLVFTGSNATIEFWFYPNSTETGNRIILGFVHPTTAAGWYVGYAEQRIYFTTNNNINQISPATYTNPHSNWYHVAVVRLNGVITLYINGVSVGTPYTGELQDYDTLLYIAQYQAKAAYYLKCNLSELRISSVARYTANFIPPRKQLESDANTKLLLHFLGSGNTFVDSSPSNHTITAYGDAKQLSSPCKSGIVKFNGSSSDYLYIAQIADFNFGTGSFTYEFSIYPVSFSVNQGLFGFGVFPASDQVVRFDTYIDTAGIFSFMIRNASEVIIANYTTTGPVILNQWNHIAIVRTGTGATCLKIYINGSNVTPPSPAIVLNDQPIPDLSSRYLKIGQYYNDQFYYTGYMTGLRISNSARYSGSTITVPTFHFIPDSNTKLLLYFDNYRNPTWFKDSSKSSPLAVTPNGSFAVQKTKTGKSLVKFDGSTNYLSLPDHDDWDFWGFDFSIVGWCSIASTSTGFRLFVQYVAADSYYRIAWLTTNVISITSKYGSSSYHFNYTGAFTPTVNTWYFISVVRSGSTCKMYVNGVELTVTINTAFGTPVGISAPLIIGYFPTEYANGNIKDLMIIRRALTQSELATIMDATDPR